MIRDSPSPSLARLTQECLVVVVNASMLPHAVPSPSEGKKYNFVIVGVWCMIMVHYLLGCLSSSSSIFIFQQTGRLHLSVVSTTVTGVHKLQLISNPKSIT